MANAALSRPMKPSPELALVIGSDALPRTEAVKKAWDYIKEKNLQNPANKRNILCDTNLKKVTGKDEITMFELTSFLSKHLSAA